MGGGAFSLGASESQAYDNRIGVTDTGRVIKGNRNQYVEAGGALLDLSGITAAKGSTLNISESNLPDGVLQALTTLASNQSSALASNQSAALSKISDLASNVGQPGQNKFALYIALGLLATVGFIFYFQKR